MRALFLDPYHSGSHAAFARLLTRSAGIEWSLLTLPGRHWKWRMRGSAAWFADQIATLDPSSFDLVVATGYVAVAELRGLAPALHGVPIVLYMHDNQLAYPVRDAYTGERDTHFGYTQILSCLASSSVWFNSAWNRDSFLREARALLRRLPDASPATWVDRIEAKSRVEYLPVELPPGEVPLREHDPRGPLIVWNHRWEHDKAPEVAFDALRTLSAEGALFRLAVCGERFRRAPRCFEIAERELSAHVVHWGYLPDRAAYHELLAQADIALSTAAHEFFGVSVLEAVHLGAMPLVPDALSYVELYPEACRFAEGELVLALRRLIDSYAAGHSLRADRRELTSCHGSDVRVPALIAALREVVAQSGSHASPTPSSSESD